MSIGWDDLQKIKRIENIANELGFEFGANRFDGIEMPRANYVSLIYLRPRGDSFPHYSRDAQIFSGTLEQIDCWLRGLEWAREYDNMLKLSSDSKRANFEQKERERQLMKTIKVGQLVQGRLTGTGVEDEEDYEMWGNGH